MTYLAIVLASVLLVSLGGNIALSIKLKRFKKSPATNTQDAKELLAHLLQGQAIIRISVIDPENLVLRSPRR